MSSSDPETIDIEHRYTVFEIMNEISNINITENSYKINTTITHITPITKLEKNGLHDAHKKSLTLTGVSLNAA